MMKMLTLAAAAAIALGGLAAAPALAQPGHDMHDMNGDNMRHRDNDRHDNDRHDNDRGHNWNHDNGRHEGWDRGHHNGWNNNRHGRQTCQWVRRHHHRERVCSWRRW
jgi:Ni/Co efflux regulator RcnB